MHKGTLATMMIIDDVIVIVIAIILTLYLIMRL
jgi:hypothetical protein